MQELSGILQTATSSIEWAYFLLNIDGGSPIGRERVYCYELYHQMRCRWPPTTPFFLNGELDKAAHPILSELGAAHAKPDLLVHRPGSMRMNHAIIEVKRWPTKKSKIIKDLTILSLFKERVEYQRAIYLLYGAEATGEAIPIIQRIANEMPVTGIEIWLHQTVGQPARHAHTL